MANSHSPAPGDSGGADSASHVSSGERRGRPSPLAAVRAKRDRFAAWLLGWDVFISYAFSERRPYARALAEQLRHPDPQASPGVRPRLVFFAEVRENDIVGRPLKQALVDGAKRSRALVLLDGRPARCREYVALEVKTAADAGRTIIPVVKKGSRKKGETFRAWSNLPELSQQVDGLTAIEESREAIKDRSPSAQTIRQIDQALGRDRTVRRFARLCLAAGVVFAALIVAAGTFGVRNVAISRARSVEAEILDGGPSSMAELTAHAASAVSLYHSPETDRAFRRAAALFMKGAPLSKPGSYALSRSGSLAMRLVTGRLERSDRPGDEASWREVHQGRFDRLALSDDGRVVALAGHDGVWIRAGDSEARCAEAPAGDNIRALALDPSGVTVAVLSQESSQWAMRVWPASACATPPAILTVTPAPDARIAIGHDGEPARLAVSPGGRALVASAPGAGWTLWRADGSTLVRVDAQVGEVARARVPVGTACADLTAQDEAFRADGHELAVVIGCSGQSSGPGVLLVPLSGDQRPRGLNNSSATHRLAYGASGKLLLAAKNNEARVWTLNGENEKEAPRLLQGLPHVEEVHFAAEDSLLLVLGRTGASSFIHVVDAGSGFALQKIEHRPATHIRPGGAGNRLAIVEHEAGRHSLFALRSPKIEYRIAGLAGAAAFTGAPDLSAVLAHARTLRLAGADRPAPTASPGPPARQVAVTGNVVYGLTGDNAGVFTCRITGDLHCDTEVRDSGGVTAIAADPVTKQVAFGCWDGRVSLAAAPCSPHPGDLATSAVTSLAVSRTAIVKVLGSRTACVSDRGRLDDCANLAEPDTTERLLPAVSPDGALVAVVAGAQSGDRLEIYHRGRLGGVLPWARAMYDRVSAIDNPGRILALTFSEDGNWLNVLTRWASQLVIVRVPASAAAIGETAS